MIDDFDDFDEELEIEELDDETVESLQKFGEDMLSYLAGTPDYEIVPTADSDGTYLKEEHYVAILKDLKKLKLKPVYMYPVGNYTIIVDPKSLKSILINENDRTEQ